MKTKVSTQQILGFVLLFFGGAVLFQNCAEAPPPGTGQTNQSSTAPSSYIAPNPTSANTTTTTTNPGTTSQPPNVSSPPLVVAPSPAATAAPTYSWSQGTWSTCNGSTQTRSVTCSGPNGTTVSDTFCTTAKPATSQACVLPYTCTVYESYSSSAIFNSGGSASTATGCNYVCTGPTTYTTSALNPVNCNANPIGVSGTETGFTNNVSVSRPFSTCVVTQQFTNTYSYVLTAVSMCN